MSRHDGTHPMSRTHHEPTDEQLLRLLAAVDTYDPDWDQVIDRVVAELDDARRTRTKRILAGVVFWAAVILIVAVATPWWVLVPLAAVAVVCAMYATGPWVGDDPNPEPATPRKVQP